MKKVLLVTGGKTSERRITLLSAQQVKSGLEKAGYKVALFDFKKGVGQLKIAAKQADVAFPLIHGREGEDGNLYTSLIKLGLPYVGCSPKSTATAFDKITFNKFCDKNKISKPKWKQVRNTKDIEKFGFPCVLKAAGGGSSREVTILQSKKDLTNKLVKKIFSLKDRFLVERFIQGIEVTGPVLFNKALPTIEIVPPEGRWFDYKNKYNGQTQEIVNAPSLDEKTKKLVQKIALEIHLKIKLDPYSRTDFIVANKIPYVLEVNPPCGVGLTAESLLPKAAQEVGISFPNLLDKLIKQALF